MILDTSNYFSKEANKKYLSVSQYKDFVGSLGRNGCEAMALAKINGVWQMEVTTSLLVGSYVDAHFEGTLGKFKKDNPDIFKKDGTLKSTYNQANEIIARIERDPLMMNALSGKKQVIMTAKLFEGTESESEWKIKIDAMNEAFTTDLKVMKSLTEKFYIKDYGRYVSFVENWGYDIQAAIYSEVRRINEGHESRKPFYIAGASKEKVTDINVIRVPEALIKDILPFVELNIPRILKLKNGEVEPVRCEICDYCKSTKILRSPVSLYDLIDG